VLCEPNCILASNDSLIKCRSENAHDIGYAAVIKISYIGYRFPPEIIQHVIWLYLQFTLSFRDVEDLLAESGILVSYEAVEGR
jgi:hypothetical protein